MLRWSYPWIVAGVVAASLTGCPDDDRVLRRGDEQGGKGAGAASGEGGESGADGGDAGAPGKGGQAGEGIGGGPAFGGSTAQGGASVTGGTGGSGTGGSGPLPCQGEGCSCEGLEADACSGESCCSSLDVPEGPFTLGGPDAAVPASIASFRLDAYEVTVGRFRRYVENYFGPPGADSGEHDYVVGSGWRPTWDALMPPDSESFRSQLGCDDATWTEGPGDNENLPMNCVTWYEAFAFCIWENGRLPTEAEWEYAAAGGDDGRTYPWGDDPAPDASHAVFGCGTGCAVDDFAEVGSKPDGAGRYGELDLAGSVAEWTLDYFAPYPMSCDNCANVDAGTERVTRGGDLASPSADAIGTRARASADPGARLWTIGFRCARRSAQ